MSSIITAAKPSWPAPTFPPMGIALIPGGTMRYFLITAIPTLCLHTNVFWKTRHEQVELNQWSRLLMKVIKWKLFAVVENSPNVLQSHLWEVSTCLWFTTVPTAGHKMWLSSPSNFSSIFLFSLINVYAASHVLGSESNDISLDHISIINRLRGSFLRSVAFFFIILLKLSSALLVEGEPGDAPMYQLSFLSSQLVLKYRTNSLHPSPFHLAVNSWAAALKCSLVQQRCRWSRSTSILVLVAFAMAQSLVRKWSFMHFFIWK